MARKLYLHIGMQKTATTSLQAFLAGNRAWLARNNILYPGIDTSNSHHAWGRQLAYGDRSEAEQAVRFWRQRIQPRIEQASDRDVLISYEGLWSLARHEVQSQPWRCELLSQCLEGFELHLVASVRRQDSWCTAMYNQQVKANVYADDIRTFVDAHVKSRLLDYSWVAAFWKKQLGVHALHFGVFEPGQLYGGNVFSDFLRHLGLSGPDHPVRRIYRSNRRLSPAGMAFKRRLNPSLRPGWRNHLALGLVRAVQPLLPAMDARLLSSEEALALMGQFDKSNADFARRILGRSDAVLFKRSTCE